jgi:hypothetical protein
MPVDDHKVDVLHATRRGGRLRAAGRLLKAVSKASAYGGLLVWLLIYWAKQDSMRSIAGAAWIILGVMAIIGLLAVYFLGQLLDRRGERYQALSAADAMSQDSRPPVLYFRSFFDEPRTRRIRTRVGSSVNYSYGRSEEEYLRPEILKVGPFVAVGRPGDPLPHLGANRLYVDDADWQAAVLRLMDGAAGAVIRVGPGEGLSWEIQQAVLRFPPERLVFVVPRDPHQYSWFKAQIDPYLPRPLPWHPDVEARNWFDRARQIRFQLLGFLYFASDWSGYFELFSFPQEENRVKFWIGDGSAAHLASDDIPSTTIQAEFTRCLERFTSGLSQTEDLTGGQRAYRRSWIRRFNPPPNWPPPPPGWLPDPGWQPDPSWPPPPENWQFWITGTGPDDADAASDTPTLPAT